jgi:hypothetical protein
MKVLYQPASVTARGWSETTAQAWGLLGDFDINALCVQGVVFEGADHYAVERVGRGCRIAVWHNDPTDWPVGSRWAREVLFDPLGPSVDPRLGGAVTTHQATIIYAEDGVKPLIEAAYAGVARTAVRAWTDFDPTRYHSRPGRWMSNDLFEAHQRARALHTWREWTDGLAASELDANGRVKDQRAQGRYVIPKGTRTYYHVAVVGPSIVGANTVNSLANATGTLTNQSSGNVGTNGALCFEAYTPSGEPDSAAWPTTGEYRYQLDVPTAGSDLTFGLLTQGNQDGYFARVNAAADTTLETFTQDQAAFSGSGLFLASVTNPAWTAGAASDRFGIVVAGVRIIGHGNQTFTLQVGELDDFADGPWPAAVAAAGQDAALLVGPF